MWVREHGSYVSIGPVAMVWTMLHGCDLAVHGSMLGEGGRLGPQCRDAIDYSRAGRKYTSLPAGYKEQQSL